MPVQPNVPRKFCCKSSLKLEEAVLLFSFKIEVKLLPIHFKVLFWNYYQKSKSLVFFLLPLSFLLTTQDLGKTPHFPINCLLGSAAGLLQFLSQGIVAKVTK